MVIMMLEKRLQTGDDPTMIMNNRELSWLVFNDRVLQEAQDKSVPLMQRLKFLGIFSNNQDEFVKVRVAKLIRLSRLKGLKGAQAAKARAAAEVLPLLYARMSESQEKFDEIYYGILAEMAEIGINVVNERRLTEGQEQFCADYYASVVSERIVPLLIRKTTKMPFSGEDDRRQGQKCALRLYSDPREQRLPALRRAAFGGGTPRHHLS